MTNLVIGIYNYLLHHRMVGMVSFVAVTAALLFLMLRLQKRQLTRLKQLLTRRLAQFLLLLARQTAQ